jgi:hypothetical protein
VKEYNEYSIQARQVMDKINESIELELEREQLHLAYLTASRTTPITWQARKRMT